MDMALALKKDSVISEIRHDLDRAWIYGYRSAQQGLMEETNPFHRHSENFILWNEGWWVGFYE